MMVAIAVLVFMIVQAQDMGASWMFTVVGILMIVGIAVSMVRAWLRGY